MTEHTHSKSCLRSLPNQFSFKCKVNGEIVSGIELLEAGTLD